MTELAKAGNHASCSIDRQQQTQCSGTPKNIALPPGYELGPAPMAPETAAAGGQPSTPPATPAAPATKPAGGPISGEIVIPKSQAPAAPTSGAANDAAATAKKAEPDSSEGVANSATDAAQAAGSTLDKAGKAVGDAAQKTWTCITSLFGDC